MTPDSDSPEMWTPEQGHVHRPPATEHYCVVVIATLDRDVPYSRELSRDRYIAKSVGEALDLHAPDPAPGTKFEIEYQGRAKMLATWPS